MTKFEIPRHITVSLDHTTLGRALIHDQHGVRCMNVVDALARSLGVTDPDVVAALIQGSFLHDVGKAWVPDWIIYKAGPLTGSERAWMEMHTLYGVQYLQAIGIDGEVSNVVRYHHERWNGSGYPEGLAGTAIPICARIVSPVDAYDALRMTRNYARYDAKGKPVANTAFSHDDAMKVIEGAAGSSFDPRVVKAFVRLKDKEFR